MSKNRQAISERLQITKRRFRSSPAQRERAHSELMEMKARQEQIKTELLDDMHHWHALVKAARFVVDVHGDPPSMDHLRDAVEAAERQIALAEESAELRKTIEKLQSDASYYQYAAGYARGSNGIAFFMIVGQGDTKAEALEKAKQSKRSC